MRFLAQQIYFATNTCEYLLVRHKICFAINNLADFSWRIAEIKWLSFGLRHEFAMHS